MGKRNSWVRQLVAERYLVWAIVLTAALAVGLLAQISLTKLQLDTDSDSMTSPIHRK